VASITAMTAAANVSPSASAPPMARIAMTSTPASRASRSRMIEIARRMPTTTEGIVQAQDEADDREGKESEPDRPTEGCADARGTHPTSLRVGAPA
jgi:hypothetical protein